MFNSRILDTLVFKNSQIYLKESHIYRTYEAYRFLNFSVTLAEIEKTYNEIENKYRELIFPNQSLRIMFSRTLPIEYQIEIGALSPLQSTLKLQFHYLTEHQTDFFKFKWENREYWQNLIEKKSRDEVDDLILISPLNEVIETTRFNIFCYEEKTLQVYTPSLTSGCLNGVFRRHVLNSKVIELPDIGARPVSEKRILTPEISGYKIFVANSVRGVKVAKILAI